MWCVLRGGVRRLPHGLLALLPIPLLTACAALSVVPDTHYARVHGQDYPVGIVAAGHSPALIVGFSLRGQGHTTLAGVGRGALACADPALRAHELGAVVYLICLPFGLVIGGIGAAATADSGASLALVEAGFGTRTAGEVGSQALALAVYHMLTDGGTEPGAALLDIPGAAAHADSASYAPNGSGAYTSLLELDVLEYRFDGSGAVGAPVCLTMKTHARKLAAPGAALVDEFTYVRRLGCHTVDDWSANAGTRMHDAIMQGNRVTAENIVQEFYLAYHPPRPPAPDPQRVVPDFVLAPIYPPPPQVYLDLNLFPRKRDTPAFGGMHFQDVDTLRPQFAWESFPRALDRPDDDADSFTDVRYDLRLYRGDPTAGVAIAPGRLVTEVEGITEPFYQLGSDLDACGWYFWTVRARFRLNGMRRATEWGGGYHTAGGSYFPSFSRRHGDTLWVPWPSDYLYYPFRTPGFGAATSCWDER